MIKIRVHDKDSRMGSTAVSDVVGRVHVGGGQRSLADFRDCSTPVKRWVPLVRYSGKGRGHVGLTVQFVPDDDAPQAAHAAEVDEECAEEVIEDVTADEQVAEDPLYGQRHAYDILRVFCDMIADAPPPAKVPIGSVAQQG